MADGNDQYLRLTKETTPGVFNASAASTDILWIRLTSGDAYKMEPDPQLQDIMGAESRNIRSQRLSRRTAFAGMLRTPLYPDQAPLLLAWGLTPDPTTYRLPTFTADHWDGVQMIRSFQLSAQRCQLPANNTQDYVMVNFTCRCTRQTPIATVARPAADVFPQGNPYCFQDSAGLVELGVEGDPAVPKILTRYANLDITANNSIWAPWDENRYVSDLKYTGRTVDWTLNKFVTDFSFRDRAEFQTKINAKIRFEVTEETWGADHHVELQLQGANYTASRDVDRGFEREQYETLQMQAFRDGVLGTDMVLDAA